jgi:hypothetical protein
VMFIVSFLPSFLRSFVRSGGFLVAVGQARDIAGGHADRGEVHGDLLGSAVRLVSRVVAAMGQAAF